MKTIALTTIPMSSTVKDVLESGLLERRLQEGLERIFVSAFCFDIYPLLEKPLKDLQARIEGLYWGRGSPGESRTRYFACKPYSL